MRIDRPQHNALSTIVLEQIKVAADALIAEPPGAVVVWGGDEIFSQGGDPGEFDHFDAALARYVSERFHAAYSAVAAIQRPTIAAVSGIAKGGGLELALACDFRMVAANARLGQTEITMGLLPGGGATQRMPRLIGSTRAKRLIFSGALVTADEAIRIGLADEIVPHGEVLGAATEWAEELAEGAGDVRGLAKQAIDRGLDLTLSEGLRMERDLFPRPFERWSAP